MATGTFSARYMRIFYRDWAFKAVLGVLIGTFTFSYTLMRHVERDAVPNLGVTLAGAFLGLGMLLFVIFLDRAIHRLRPVAVAALVAKAGRRALSQVLAEAARAGAPAVVPAPYDAPGEPSLVVEMTRGGAIQAIDFRGLGAWAHANSSLVVLRHPVGDFVSAGAALIEVYGPTPGPDDGGSTSLDGRARCRADDRAGSGIRGPDHGRHRDPCVVAGGQRPDDGRAGPGPPRRPAAARGPDGPVRPRCSPSATWTAAS